MQLSLPVSLLSARERHARELQKPQSVAVPACFVLLAQVSARLVSVT